MDTTLTKTSESLPKGLPGQPITSIDVSELYVLYYREGSNPHPMQKNFRMAKTHSFNDVVKRAKEHCEQMNLRFYQVRPWFSDFAAEEKRRNIDV